MPKLPSANDTAPSASTNNKGKGKALQPVSVATRVLPPRKRVSALASSSNISSTTNARATSTSSSSPPPPPSSSSSSSSPDGTAPTLRRLSERKSHLHPSYIAYSPRTDPTLYLDQLDTPMSDIRDKKRRARSISSFSELNVPSPVPSKRLRHHPRSRVHHAQQKYKERQQAAAAAAAAARAAATAVAQQQHQQHQQHQASSSRSSSSLHRRGPEYAYPRDSLQVQLTQDLPVIDDRTLNEKAKEKEYWRRQRRVFVRSRFITNEEATAIANSVYKSNPVGPQDRIVVTFQANIANFRSKWRKLLKELVKKFAISRNLVTAQDSEPFEQEVKSKVDIAMLQKIWGHWLSDPFVDEDAFYANPQNVDTLTAVTVQAICVTLRYHYGLMKERDFRKQLDDLDKYTRNLQLPDPFSSVH